ncbi:MAG: GspH/FimT family pseudopilin, partial [Candidatus Omnitrophota bacterium]
MTDKVKNFFKISAKFVPARPSKVVAGGLKGVPFRTVPKAFTLIEVIMVVVVMSVLIAVLASVRNSPLQNRVAAASQKIKSDIRYAQSYAVASQDRTRVSFDSSADSYSVYVEQAGGSWSLMSEPLTNETFTVGFTSRSEYFNVDIVSTDFDGSGYGVVFDAGGVPYSYNPSSGAIAILSSEGSV